MIIHTTVESFRQKYFAFLQLFSRITATTVMSTINMALFSELLPYTGIFAFALHFICFYTFSYLVEWLVSLFYKPRFMNKNTMNVADFIDHSLVDKKEYDVLEQKTYMARFLAEKQFWTGMVSVGVYLVSVSLVSILSPATLQMQEYFTSERIVFIFAITILHAIGWFLLSIFRFHLEYDIQEQNGEINVLRLPLYLFFAAIVYVGLYWIIFRL